MYHCYILYSSKLDKYYVGYTSDMEGRLLRHNSSTKGFTSLGKPWELKYSESFASKSLAMLRERELKSWKSRRMLEDLIGD